MEPNTKHEGHSHTVLSPGYNRHKNPIVDLSSHERKEMRTGNKGLHVVFRALMDRGWPHG
ncbi:MAG: hypothetical protein WBA22_00850 [Candidatus Methanofastidiosia archaeon]